jgi:hypothetical protein
MARFGDRGPYAVGNVRIITQQENVAELDRTNQRLAMIGNQHLLGHKHSPETRPKISTADMGRVPSAKTRAKLSAHARQQHAEGNLGVASWTEESRVKMSAAIRRARLRVNR